MKPPLNKNREFKYPLKRAQRRREPLRTTRELADVVGISVHRLYVLLRLPDAPAPFTRGVHLWLILQTQRVLQVVEFASH